MNEAVGINKITPRDIKAHKEKVTPILLKLYNSIFQSVIAWKLETAILRPILKEETNEVLNYKPICDLSVLNYIRDSVIDLFEKDKEIRRHKIAVCLHHTEKEKREG